MEMTMSILKRTENDKNEETIKPIGTIELQIDDDIDIAENRKLIIESFIQNLDESIIRKR